MRASLIPYSIPPYPTTLLPYTPNHREIHMNTQNAIDAIIDRTLAIIDKGIDNNVGDMTLMQAMEFVGVLMDIRERQQAYVKRTQKKVRMCGKACTKMPKRK